MIEMVWMCWHMAAFVVTMEITRKCARMTDVKESCAACADLWYEIAKVRYRNTAWNAHTELSLAEQRVARTGDCDDMLYGNVGGARSRLRCGIARHIHVPPRACINNDRAHLLLVFAL